MKHRIAAIVLAFGTAGCAGSAGPEMPGPESALAYRMPPVSTLVYLVADTVTIDMDIGGTPVNVTVQSDATMEADFTEAAGALRAEIRYTRMTGSFANSMAAPTPISNADIPGPATVTLDPVGEVTVVELPESSEAFRQIFGAESAYRRLFIPLPARAVQPGEMWTDTVSLTEDIGAMTSATSHVVTSTLVGDTLVGGRRLQVISSDISGTTRISGVNQGMEIRQYISGSSSAVTLWDPARRAIVERIEIGNGQGSMELPAMGMTGLPLSMRSKAVIRLQDR